MARTRRLDGLTSVGGVRVGTAESPERPTGVTVVLFDALAPVVVDVRGPASGTYDTASLALGATFGRRDAVLLAGGSVYGLDAGRGIRTSLLNQGRGEGAFGSTLPLPRISGAVLYDLPREPRAVTDYLPLGFAAAESASRAPLAPGAFGAGAGARVGKYAGLTSSSPGGQATAARRLDPTHTIGLLMVFNSVGAIRDPANGRLLGGARDRTGRILAPEEGALRARTPRGAGTTLGVVVTDLPVDRRLLAVLADHVHDGIARVVLPAHTATEGDTVFAACTASPGATPTSESRPGEIADRLSWVAELLVAEAARRLFSGPSAPDGRSRDRGSTRSAAAAYHAAPG